MKVYGYEIKEEQIKAALRAMKKDNFVSTDIEITLIDAGVPEFIGRCWPYEKQIAYRAADRLIQRERKKTLIYFNGKAWNQVPF